MWAAVSGRDGKGRRRSQKRRGDLGSTGRADLGGLIARQEEALGGSGWGWPLVYGLWSLGCGLWDRCGRVPAGRTTSRRGCVCVWATKRVRVRDCDGLPSDGGLLERESCSGSGSGMGWPSLRPGRVEKLMTMKNPGSGGERSDEFLKKDGSPVTSAVSQADVVQWLTGHWTGGMV